MLLLPAFTQSTINDLVHDAYVTGKIMIKTHHKEDILRFVRIAQRLQDFGFRLQWVKHQGCVGVTHIKGGNHAVVGSFTKPNAFGSGL